MVNSLSVVLASVVVATTAVLGNPIQNSPRSTRGEGSFSVPLVTRSHNFKQKRDGSDWTHEDTISMWEARVITAKAKYGILDDSTTSKKVKRAPSTGSTYLAGNSESYYASIEVGTPAKTFEVVLDTGSSDLVILTTASQEACSINCTITGNLYETSASSTAQNLGTAEYVQYGTGSANGTLVSDMMSFAGFSATQNFIASDSSDGLVTSSDQSGLFGLAWQTISASGAVPFVQALFEAGSLTNPLFGFGLAQLDPQDVPDPNSVVSGGILTVGDTNSSLYTGTLNWVTLSDSGSYWNIPLDALSVNGANLGLSDSAAVIDTGTNGIALPQEAADAVYSSIPNSQVISRNSGLYAYPCSTDISLSFTFGGMAYTMLPKDFNGGAANSAGTLCVGAVISLGSSSSSSGSIPWIIGTPFLMTYYNAYRYSPPAVGFATMTTTASALKGPIPSSGSTSSSSSGSSGSSGSGSSGGSTPSSSGSSSGFLVGGDMITMGLVLGSTVLAGVVAVLI